LHGAQILLSSKQALLFFETHWKIENWLCRIPALSLETKRRISAGHAVCREFAPHLGLARMSALAAWNDGSALAMFHSQESSFARMHCMRFL
jgi:hypothetical protein